MVTSQLCLSLNILGCVAKLQVGEGRGPAANSPAQPHGSGGHQGEEANDQRQLECRHLASCYEQLLFQYF